MPLPSDLLGNEEPAAGAAMTSEFFAALDVDQDGMISPRELRDGVRRMLRGDPSMKPLRVAIDMLGASPAPPRSLRVLTDEASSAAACPGATAAIPTDATACPGAAAGAAAGAASSARARYSAPPHGPNAPIFGNAPILGNAPIFGNALSEERSPSERSPAVSSTGAPRSVPIRAAGPPIAPPQLGSPNYSSPQLGSQLKESETEAKRRIAELQRQHGVTASRRLSAEELATARVELARVREELTTQLERARLELETHKGRMVATKVAGEEAHLRNPLKYSL